MCAVLIYKSLYLVDIMIGSIQDWVVLAIVALILFGGAKKIPELFRNLGKAMGEFKKGQMEMNAEMENKVFKKAVKPKSNTKVAKKGSRSGRKTSSPI